MHPKSRVGEARASYIRPEVPHHQAIQSIHVNTETDLRRVKVKVKFTLEQAMKARTGRTDATILLL